MVADGVMTPLPASLTLHNAKSVLESLRQAFAAGSGDVWRLDASAITQVDTSALAVLLECARMAVRGSRKLEIVAPPARLSDLAHLVGVDAMLGLPSTATPAVTLVDVPVTKTVPTLN